MEAILITGVPGSGKTTISKLLANKLKCNVMSVTEVVREKKLYVDVEEDECGNPLYVVDMDRLEDIVNQLDGCWIIEGVVVDFVDPNKVKKVIYVQANVSELIKRMKEKGYCKAKICSNVEAELVGSYYQMLKEMYGEKVTCIRSDVPIEETLEQALRAASCEKLQCLDHPDEEWEEFFRECFPPREP